MNIIETKKLVKRYGTFTAVDAVDLSVDKGEIYGFLGLNGAGKTTTIRMLLGMIKPTSGEAFLAGKNIRQADLALWNKVGCLVEIPYAYPELTVRENLEMFCRLRNLHDCDAVNRVMDLFKLTQFKDRQARHLSLGNSQRLGLAKALLHAPEILILDEPANGLDPAGIVETRDLLTDLAQNHGVTVFISSHILGEIAKFAGRIGIIHHARMVQEIDADVLEGVLNRTLSIEANDRERTLGLLRQQGLTPETAADGLIRVKDKEAVLHPDQINARLVKEGCIPRQIRIDEEDLESYFLRIITNTGGEA